jgi:hypothetical protein
MRKERTPKFFLIHIRMDDRNFSAQRAHEILEDIKGFTNDMCQPAYTTHDARSFGFIVKTKIPAAAMAAMLDGTEWVKERSAILLNDDKFFIFEIGEEFAERGFSVTSNWIKHNQNSSTS